MSQITGRNFHISITSFDGVLSSEKRHSGLSTALIGEHTSETRLRFEVIHNSELFGALIATLRP